MSIGIAIAVPDGIALAADTQTTWNQTILKVKEKQSGKAVELASPIHIPVGWSRMARKLFSVEMNGTIYAIITAGMAHMNSKSMYAVIHSCAPKLW
jgi:opacity protein-like surface antigen